MTRRLLLDGDGADKWIRYAENHLRLMHSMRQHPQRRTLSPVPEVTVELYAAVPPGVDRISIVARPTVYAVWEGKTVSEVTGDTDATYGTVQTSKLMGTWATSPRSYAVSDLSSGGPILGDVTVVIRDELEDDTDTRRPVLTTTTGAVAVGEYSDNVQYQLVGKTDTSRVRVDTPLDMDHLCENIPWMQAVARNEDGEATSFAAVAVFKSTVAQPEQSVVYPREFPKEVYTTAFFTYERTDEGMVPKLLTTNLSTLGDYQTVLTTDGAFQWVGEAFKDISSHDNVYINTTKYKRCRPYIRPTGPGCVHGGSVFYPLMLVEPPWQGLPIFFMSDNTVPEASWYTDAKLTEWFGAAPYYHAWYERQPKHDIKFEVIASGTAYGTSYVRVAHARLWGTPVRQLAPEALVHDALGVNNASNKYFAETEASRNYLWNKCYYFQHPGLSVDSVWWSAVLPGDCASLTDELYVATFGENDEMVQHTCSLPVYSVQKVDEDRVTTEYFPIDICAAMENGRYRTPARGYTPLPGLQQDSIYGIFMRPQKDFKGSRSPYDTYSVLLAHVGGQLVALTVTRFFTDDITTVLAPAEAVWSEDKQTLISAAKGGVYRIKTRCAVLRCAGDVGRALSNGSEVTIPQFATTRAEIPTNHVAPAATYYFIFPDRDEPNITKLSSVWCGDLGETGLMIVQCNREVRADVVEYPDCTWPTIRSLDAGYTWEEIPTLEGYLLGPGSCYSSGIADDEGKVGHEIICLAQKESSGELFHAVTRDYGETWTISENAVGTGEANKVPTTRVYIAGRNEYVS